MSSANRKTSPSLARLGRLTTLMMAVCGVSVRRGGTVAVTAFATFGVARSIFSRSGTRSSSFAAIQSSTTSKKHNSNPSFLSNKGLPPPLGTTILRQSSSTSAVVAPPVLDLTKAYSTTHPSYEVISRDIVTEYGAYCTLYKHTKSGAELLSVSVDDDNKVFGITLRTPPEDSTGVPHILEHSVLCGSRKYKTKDPFVHLLKGSLQTFLNAFTYPDRTCYVVASQNLKDFYNLVNVYADAVYHPRAVTDPMVHAQEGWHLELDEEEDKLIYNGVV